MARVSTYLNFPRNTEAAFEFYRSVLGGRLADRFGLCWMVNRAAKPA